MIQSGMIRALGTLSSRHPARIELREVSRERFTRLHHGLSPLLARVSITLLVIFLARVRLDLEKSPEPIGAGRDRRTGFARPLLTPSCATVAASLIGLNPAAWRAWPPTPFVIRIASVWNEFESPGQLTFEGFFRGRPMTVILRVDGRTRIRRRVDASDQHPFTADEIEIGQVAKRGYSLDEATIEFESDDSIVTHGGTHDDKLSEPRVLRPAHRSPLDLWWPRSAGMVITLSVIVELGRLVLGHAPGVGGRSPD